MMSAMNLPAGLEEALSKAGVVWVDFGAGPRVAWHRWHDGCVWLVCGGLEQDLPGAAAHATAQATSTEDETPAAALPAARHATVVVRSPAGDALRFLADVRAVEPGSAEWASVVPLLHEKRLNPPDSEAQPDRWARESLVLRLTPR
jgi:hypothetical protein